MTDERICSPEQLDDLVAFRHGLRKLTCALDDYRRFYRNMGVTVRLNERCRTFMQCSWSTRSSKHRRNGGGISIPVSSDASGSPECGLSV